MNQDPSLLSTSDTQTVKSHNQLMNLTGLYQSFLDFHLPNLTTKNNISSFIAALASADPDQTILVKTAYDQALMNSSNFLYADMFNSLQPVMDFKSCFAYAHGKPPEQRLANFSDGLEFCQPLLTYVHVTSLVFRSDSHVFTFLQLLKSGSFDIQSHHIFSSFLI